VRIAGEHRDPLAVGNADLGQARSQARNQRVELGVGPLDLTADDRGLVGHTPGRAMEDVAQGLAAN